MNEEQIKSQILIGQKGVKGNQIFLKVILRKCDEQIIKIK